MPLIPGHVIEPQIEGGVTHDLLLRAEVTRKTVQDSSSTIGPLLATNWRAQNREKIVDCQCDSDQ